MVKLTVKTASIERNGSTDTGSVYLDDEQPVSPSLYPVARGGGSVRRKIAIFEQIKRPKPKDYALPCVLTPAKKAERQQMDPCDSKYDPFEFAGVSDEAGSGDVYDLTPVAKAERRQPTSLYSIDPFELSKVRDKPENNLIASSNEHIFFSESMPESDVYTTDEGEHEDVDEDDFLSNSKQSRSTFLAPGDIHPNMENKEADIQRLRLLAGTLSADWGHFMAPALARRIRDFQFAQDKRRKKYGDERPWGVLGVYDHLASIRIDVEWAEDAALRRANGESYQSWAEFDENKKGGSNRPYFTYILLFVCTILMVAAIAVNDWTIEPLDVNPMVGPSAQTLILMGARDSKLIVIEKEGWRLVTSSFLHAGFIHYFINMLALWFVGGAIEMSHGWLAALVIFSFSAVGGSILSAIFLPEYISVGASGGIFGFIGACLADIIMNWKLIFCDFVTENGKKHRHALVVVALLFDIALNCVIGLTPFVDNYSHLGGMFYGFLCGMCTIQRLSANFFGIEERWTTKAKHLFMRFLGVIISLAFLTSTLIVLMNGDAKQSPCPGCTWLSCVPLPPWGGQDDKWWYCNDDCVRVTAYVVTTPSLHLELACPSGTTAIVDLSHNESVYESDKVQKNLPKYCRAFCNGEFNSNSSNTGSFR